MEPYQSKGLAKNPHLEGTPNEFFKENEKLVHFGVGKYRNVITNNPSLDYDDLVSIGMMGMMKAYERFDGNRSEAKFSTYAISMIRWEVLMYFENQLDTIHFPKSAKKVYKEIWEKELLHLEVKELSEILEVTPRIVEQALDYGRWQDVGSLDIDIYDDGGTPVTLGDIVPNQVDYDSKIIVEDYLSKLETEERHIADLVFKGLSQADIAKEIGKSQSYVSVVFTEILKKAEEYRKPKNVKVKKKVEKEIKRKKPQNIRKKVSSCKPNSTKRGSEMYLSQKEIERFKNAFFEGWEIMNELERAKKLVADIQLSSKEIVNISGLDESVVEKLRTNYIESISSEETSLAIRELLHSTQMSNDAINERLKCGPGPIEKEKRRILSKDSKAPMKGNTQIMLKSENISIEEIRKILDSVEELGVTHLNINITN